MDCFHCNQPLANPLCPSCTTRMFVAWVSRRTPTALPYLDVEFPEVGDMDTEVFCIRCAEPMNMCMECVTHELQARLEIVCRDMDVPQAFT